MTGSKTECPLSVSSDVSGTLHSTVSSNLYDENFSSSASTSISSNCPLCRICQLSEAEAGEALRTTGCECRGSLGEAHDSCLNEWARVNRSTRCELCTGTFEGITVTISPRRPQQEARDDDEDDEARYRFLLPEDLLCPTNIRACLVGAVITLFILTVASGLVTQKSYGEYKLAWTNQAVFYDPQYLEDARFLFAVSLGVFVFCATSSVATMVIWAVWEVLDCSRQRRFGRRAVFRGPVST